MFSNLSHELVKERIADLHARAATERIGATRLHRARRTRRPVKVVNRSRIAAPVLRGGERG